MSLGAIVKAVCEMRESMRAAGASVEEIHAATERSVRSAWPFTREWKYLCQRCDDYGLEMFYCPGDDTCGRAKVHPPHNFARACWCSHGERFKKKPKTDADFQEAGKTPKAKTFTRFGRSH